MELFEIKGARSFPLRRLLIASYVILFAVGCAAFILSDIPTPETPRFDSSMRSRAGARVNWASIRSGGRVRASGWDRFRNHHPLYLIDGEPYPGLVEKWATLREQRVAWIEILPDKPRSLSEITLFHAGWKENKGYTSRRYTIRCYRKDEMVAELRVTGNEEPIAHHPMECPDTDRVLIEFDRRASEADAVIRLFEVQAWGSP